MEVLIVGAGPTGLLAAAELARRGIDCRIIEREERRSPHSKALAVHARTLEVLDLAGGLADQLVSHGLPVPGIGLSPDGRPPVLVSLARLDSRYPFILVLPQRDTEEVLESHLSRLGVMVQRGTELITVTQDRDGVTATLRRGGERLEVRSRYMIGSDGAHSAVRTALGLSFEGRRYGLQALLADAEVEGREPAGWLRMFTSDRGPMLLVPFRDGSVRVVVIDFAKQHAPPDAELDLADLQDSVDAIAPSRLVLSAPRWRARFGAAQRQVDSYRVGRVFLAGDAAHVHNPLGGQGMNIGLQDAWNLGWKLALVLRGGAPDALLDTYHAERHPVGARTLRLTDTLLRGVLLRGAIPRAARRLVLSSVVPLPAAQRRIAETISGLAVSYPDGGRFRDLDRIRRPGYTLLGAPPGPFTLIRPDGYIASTTLR